MSTPRARLARAVFEVYLFSVCILVGGVGLAYADGRSRSIVAAFPGPAQVAWYVVLLLCSILSLVGIARGDDLGLLLERAALVPLGGLCLSFGIAALAFSGPSGLSGGIMLGGFGVACFVRAWQVTADLSRLRAELRQRVEAQGGAR